MENKVYIVWAVGQDCSEIHEICAKKEKAEELKEELLINIALIKLDYKEQFGRNYDEDKEKILTEDVDDNLINEFYNFEAGYLYELGIEDVYIQEHTLA